MEKFFIILLCLFPLTLHSQNSISIGPLAGVNINFYSGSGVIESSKGIGPVFGGLVDLLTTPKWGFLGRILYDDKSGSFTSEDTNSQGNLQNIENKISLAYITIDGLLQYRLSEAGLSIHAGPSFGFPIHGTNEHTVFITSAGLDTGTTTNDSTKIIKEDIESLSTRFEIKFGLGYDIALSKQFALTVQSSLAWGFGKVKESFNWRITSWQTIIGLKFNLH